MCDSPFFDLNCLSTFTFIHIELVKERCLELKVIYCIKITKVITTAQLYIQVDNELDDRGKFNPVAVR